MNRDRASIRSRAHPGAVAVLALIALPLGAPAAATAAPVVRHLYALAGQSPVRVIPFDIDAAGQITARTDQAVITTTGASSLLVAPDAKTIYVGIQDSYANFSTIPGTIRAYAIAADGSLSLAQTVAASPRTLALTPDGSRLFVQLPTGQVTSFRVAADGTLGTQAATTTVGGGGAMTLAVKPDGTTLYVGAFPSFVEQWAIGPGGSLTPQLPTDVDPGSCRIFQLYVTPDSRALDALCSNPRGGFTYALTPGGGMAQVGGKFDTYAGYLWAADVRGRALYSGVFRSVLEQLQRQPDGTLRDYPASYYVNANIIQALATDPSGTVLSVATSANDLETYAIAADGSLSPSPTATIAASYPLQVLAYAPVRGPVAAFGASVGGSRAVAFDAGASTSAPGTAVARYDWSFGDGTALSDGGPAPAHTYPGTGVYTVTVTVTDSFGCSAAGRFGGAMSSCAPSPDAVAAHTVVVAAPPAATGAAAAAAAAAAAGGSGAGEPAVTPASGTTRSEAARPEGATAVPAASGADVLLSWTRPAGADEETRYLVAWSTLHSAHGPGDRNMHHIRLTGRTSIALRTRPGTTLHLAVYAWAADGSITRATKTTLRLPRA